MANKLIDQLNVEATFDFVEKKSFDIVTGVDGA